MIYVYERLLQDVKQDLSVEMDCEPRRYIGLEGLSISRPDANVVLGIMQM